LIVDFTIQPPALLGVLPLIILVATGVVLVVVAVVSRSAKKFGQSFVALLVIGVVVIALGVGLSYGSTGSTIITVGSGYLYVKSSSFGGPGNLNVTTGEVQSAYVARIGVGNLTISKQHGTNIGDYNVGVFTLGNGATAYVASDNSTDLVLLLSSGEYVILGTNDTTSLVSTFSQSVHAVSGPSAT
jgi:hypothetical protein